MRRFLTGLCGLILVIFAGKSKSQCSQSNRTTFLRSQGVELRGGSKVTLRGVSLMACSQACMDNIDDRNQHFDCNSFHFITSSETCVLSSDSAQPFGPGHLVSSDQGRDMAFFQELCLPSQQLCDAPFSFERVPQHVLVGYALEVFRAATLSDCLRSCLESVRTFRIECKSVMYYYETNECILNREDQRNRPDLFSGDTQGFIVDYFDNNCAGTQCFAPEVLQYAKTENKELENHRDVKLMNIDLASCQHFCNVNQNGRGDLFPCKAFMYDKRDLICYLSSEKALPRGRGRLLDNANMDYNEKFCLTASETCGGVTAFDRVEMRVLVGFAREVIEMPSLIECLDACISAQNRKGFACMSVMYYYNTTECLLNTESRSSKPHLFSNDTQGYMVDYFENNCFNNPGLCPRGYDRIYLKAENTELPGFDTSGMVSGFDPKDCIIRCTDETQFVCRSVDFRFNQCAWSYQDTSLISLSHAPPVPTTYYEARCVEEASICGNFFYGFEYKRNKEFTGFVLSTVTGISSSDCLSICLKNTGVSRCLSLNYDTLTSSCQINSENCRSTSAENLRQRTGVDYYENQCTSVPLECAFEEITQNQRPKSIYRLQTAQTSSAHECQTLCEQSLDFPCRSAAYEPRSGACDLSDFDTRKPPDGDEFLQPAIGFQYFEKGPCTGSSISIDCRFDGVRVTVSFPEPASGSIFVKNRFSTCRNDFNSAEEAVLNIPFPGALSSTGPGRGLDGNQDCAGSEIAPNIFSYTVVVQKNNFGIPGLISQGDQLFNATCDYTNQITRVTQAVTQANVEGVSDFTRQIAGKGQIGFDQVITMHILRDGLPINQALLGEECDLFWRIGETAPPGFGFFVRDCQAERLGGNPPDPEPLKLITDGCPDPNVQNKIISEPVKPVQNGFITKMVMFRFDGSRSVKLRCVIDMCIGTCELTNCPLDNKKADGRAKRQSWTYNPANKDVKFFTNTARNRSNSMDNGHRGVVNKGTISGVFTIVDRLPEGAGGNRHGLGSVERKSVLHIKGEICLLKPLFISIFTFLALFCFAEGSFVFVFCWQKYHKRRRTSPVSDSGWETSTQATTHYKGQSTAANTMTTRKRTANRSDLSTLSDWQAYADRKLHAVGQRLRQRAGFLQAQLGKKAPPSGAVGKQNKKILCEESSSDIYPSEDGHSTSDSRKRLTKKTRRSRRPYPNVLMALPAPVDTSSECASTTDRRERNVHVRVETYTQEILRQPAVIANPNAEVILLAPSQPLYENSRYPPPVPPKRKQSLATGQQQGAPPLPPRTPSACSARSRSTLDGVKIGSPSGSLSDRGCCTPAGSVGSNSDDTRRVRFEEWPPPPPSMCVDRGYRSHDYRDDDKMHSLAQEVCERAVYMQK